MPRKVVRRSSLAASVSRLRRQEGQNETRIKPKALAAGAGRAFGDGEPGGDLLSHMKYALSSACLRFTVLFGMGRGGSKGLWPPSITVSHDAGSVVRKMGRRGCDVVLSCCLRL